MLKTDSKPAATDKALAQLSHRTTSNQWPNLFEVQAASDLLRTLLHGVPGCGLVADSVLPGLKV